ncbi:hypothetical protein NLG97_g7550 [Lecanicillium saksenae]|uniref:Uncharacterized protein n=1 Tax=Lecanicillium saksenae TaxID=468837 RepID=A0ACC1QPQ2_9HYPO|nr:hypothetical protein NLG97_g7550 [Lecanicillium saksenae]
MQQTTREFLLKQVKQDPGLPRPQPTTSFWQVPPHPTLAEKQSDQLPESTDIAIIGSGVTGCSVAKHILDISSHSGGNSVPSVTVFEARTLVSGATGRNGGLLTSFVPEEFGDLREQYGTDEAIKIARFANRNLEKLHELANTSEERTKLSQVRRLRDVISFSNADDFAEAKESWTAYEEFVPEEKGKTEFFSPEEAAQKFNVRAGAGVVTFPNGACWPYRLIIDIWSEMCDQYQSRLSIETKTPVESITYDESDATHPYTLHTPRGKVKVARVIHATNGYAGHLLPAIRGSIYPLRGSMSVQKSTTAFGDHGNNLTWSMANRKVYERATDVLEAGSYYACQNGLTGDIFIGGEKTKAGDFFVTDDTEVNVHCRDNFATLLPRYFVEGWANDGPGPEIRTMWTGIMGFTGDRLPLVGQVPEEVTQRGRGEWMAAGFNGYGMSLCWACGEAVAKMVLGIDVADFLPGAFLVTTERIKNPARRGPLDAVLDVIDA